MIAQSRHRRILDLLEKHSSLTSTELAGVLETSPATIRRDVDFLAKAGQVLRTHGAVHSPKHARGEPSFDRKTQAAVQAKHALALAAAELAKPGETVFVDAGSTALAAGRQLLLRGGLTIFTNSLPLLESRPVPDTRLIALGGEVRPLSRALVGATALDWIHHLRFDLAYLGASGIDPAEGPSTTELSEAAVKGAIATRTSRVVLLADSSKWGQPAAVRFAGWTQVHDLFTNHRISSPERKILTGHGTCIHIVST